MPQSEIVLIWKALKRPLVNQLGNGVCHLTSLSEIGSPGSA